MIGRRAVLGLLAAAPVKPVAAQIADWDAMRARARGQTVHWWAWAGDERVNALIAWAGERVQALHGVAVRHVKLRDTAEAVAKVIAEKAAGRDAGGAVDLVWINGPNFLAMKEQGLLAGPLAESLPNFRFVDVAGKPATTVDFTVPVEGYAVPWRMAQVVFIRDAARLQDPPRSAAAMLAWAERNSGRLAHPHVRNFLGVTFLKQALLELAPDPAALRRPPDDDGFAAATAPLWAWYERLRPFLWRGGRQFPENGPAQRALMNDGEIDLMISFNPSEASTAIANGLLPPTARAHGLARGTIGNASFVAIPYNAAHKEGAAVLADFLISAEAQAHAQDPRVTGAFTVLDVDRLPAAERARFDALPRGAATPTQAELGPPLPEPHPAWMTRITAEWERRYSR